VPTEESALIHVAKIGLKDEYTDALVYEELSKRTSNASFAETLGQLAAAERKHYEFWHRYAPDEKVTVSRFQIWWVLFLKTVFGVTFTVRYLERHEGEVIKAYKSVRHLIPEGDRAQFDDMLADELSHEAGFSQRIEGSTIRYISFVVLGLADALVEVTGIHAGSLGIYNKTEYAGLAGVIAGAAASLAMASAAYAQAKQGFQGSAKLSAVYTGISYFVTAVLLATPYFLTANMIYALASSLTLAVIILAFATFYSSVISNKPFARDFAEILSIMFGVTVALYVFGFFIRVTTGITV
jgi:VIT1/CCC1 family predicted Fe2+/Mn2+ transporter